MHDQALQVALERMLRHHKWESHFKDVELPEEAEVELSKKLAAKALAAREPLHALAKANGSA